MVTAHHPILPRMAKFATLILCFISINLLLPSAWGAVQTVSLTYETTPNPPRFFGLGTAIDWKKPGISLDVLQEVARRLGIKFEYSRRPWVRGLYLLENNKVDGIFHSSYKKKRTAFGVYPLQNGVVDPSRAIFVQRYNLYKRRGSPLTWDGSSLENLQGSVAVIRGYAIKGDLEKMAVPVVEVSSQEKVLEKVLRGKIDAFANLEGMTDYYLSFNRNRFADIEKMSPPFKAKPYHLMFSRQFYQQHQTLAERIWDEIRTVNSSPVFETISQKYR